MGEIWSRYAWVGGCVVAGNDDGERLMMGRMVRIDGSRHG